jgi:hypothetical protein
MAPPFPSGVERHDNAITRQEINNAKLALKYRVMFEYLKGLIPAKI